MKIHEKCKPTKKESIHKMIEEISNERNLERVYILVAYLYRNEADE